MLKFFRWLGWLEGGSLLLLLFVAMPVKYIGGEPVLVRVVGMIHGLLFMAYCGLAAVYATNHNWSKSTLIKAWVLSVFPFGTFYFDHAHLREEAGKT